jgi:biopolymer transport protein ExbB
MALYFQDRIYKAAWFGDLKITTQAVFFWGKIVHRLFVSAVRRFLLVVGFAGALAFPAAAAETETTAMPAVAVASAVANDFKKSAEAMDNPYGIEALWKTSDAITKTVLLLLAIMSMGSWYYLVIKVLEQNKMKSQFLKVTQDFWGAPTLEKGVATLAKGSAYQFIANSGLAATKKHVGLVGQIPLTDWVSMNISRSLEKVNSNMQSGLAFLATVGSTSPFVGLFGTVWGIYHALTAIGISGQASIDKVAGPVGEALIMTAIGLAVAVPAVLSYNWLVRRNKAVMDDVRSFGGDLHAVLLSSASKA